MLDPASRRRWLLTKALEAAPLGEALALAQAAEEFISGTAARTADRASSEIMRVPALGAWPKAEGTQPELLSALPVRSNQPPGKNDQPLRVTEVFAGLSSLVSVDDVIHYLQKDGEDFAEDASADELITRANLSRAEQGLPPFALIATPSTKTVRQDKPEKRTVPRPLSARERAEWARSVVALPAE
jgi:hypothetical protein